MAGPSKGLAKTGACGRHKPNIKRDMIRKVGKVVTWLIQFLLWTNRKMYMDQKTGYSSDTDALGTAGNDFSPDESSQAEEDNSDQESKLHIFVF